MIADWRTCRAHGSRLLSTAESSNQHQHETLFEFTRSNARTAAPGGEGHGTLHRHRHRSGAHGHAQMHPRPALTVRAVCIRLAWRRHRAPASVWSPLSVPHTHDPMLIVPHSCASALYISAVRRRLSAALSSAACARARQTCTPRGRRRPSRPSPPWRETRSTHRCRGCRAGSGSARP